MLHVIKLSWPFHVAIATWNIQCTTGVSCCNLQPEISILKLLNYCGISCSISDGNAGCTCNCNYELEECKKSSSEENESRRECNKKSGTEKRWRCRNRHVASHGLGGGLSLPPGPPPRQTFSSPEHVLKDCSMSILVGKVQKFSPAAGCFYHFSNIKP